MPLVTCPDCGERVSDAAPACIHCGRPNPAAGASRAPAFTQGSVPELAATFAEAFGVPLSNVRITHDGVPAAAKGDGCPRCGSEEVRSFKDVYRSGVVESHTTGTVRDGYWGGDRQYVSTTTRTRTAAGAAAAPPEKKPIWACILLFPLSTMMGFVVGIPLGGIPGVVLGSIAGFWWAWWYLKKNLKYNREVWAPAHKKWKASYRCATCGHKFVDETRAARLAA